MIKLDYTSNINLSTKKSVTPVNWLPNDDPRRSFYTINNGLNMKGSCRNPSCISVSYNMQNDIWLMKGQGIFDMAFIKSKNVCPGCNTKMDPSSFTNFGYRNAKVTIEGTKLTNNGGYFVRTIEEDHTGDLIIFKTKQNLPNEWC